MALAPSVAPVAAVAPVSGASWWDAITGGITQISGIANQVYGVKTQLQNLKNAQAAQPSNQFVGPLLPSPSAPSAPAGGQTSGGTGADSGQNKTDHTMLYIGGAVVVALFGFMMLRK